MLEQEFKVFSQGLIEQWGVGSYTMSQLSILSRLTKDISYKDLNKALDELALTCTRPPSIAQIKAHIQPALDRAQQAEKSQTIARATSDRCPLCSGTGWVTIYRDEDPATQVSVLCVCPIPEALGIKAGPSKFQPKTVAKVWSHELVEQGWNRLEQSAASIERYFKARGEYRANGNPKLVRRENLDQVLAELGVDEAYRDSP